VKRFRAGSITVLALLVSLLLARVHPFGDAGLYRAHAAEAPIPEHASIPPQARAILTAKCADCHSDQTHAPVYGRFAPISWLLERDIVEGRKQMDLSQWDSYSPDQQQTFAAKIVQETKTHEMPLPQFRMIHWSARITAADLQTLTQWSRGTSGADTATQATTAGDPDRGKALFEKRCTGCHALTQSHEGPRLLGVYGRSTGSVPGFPYSDVLKKANIVWNDQTLEKWLTDPDAFLPGNNMDFLLARPQERKDIISYFKLSPSVTAPH
jgi:cytochrome c